MVQELVPGPETAIESYHVYVDAGGRTVREFAGVKLRTEPPEFGESTAVRITEQADVLAEGRRVISAIGFRDGVAKVDFKRAPDGGLWLLEVNPRFNLWHHPGAAAGANLPALVYADLVGGHRPEPASIRSGVTWCEVREDLKALVRAGRSPWSWLRSVVRAHTRSTGSWSDPMPLLRGLVLPALRNRLPGTSGRG
jgi:D-aspartate ligase